VSNVIGILENLRTRLDTDAIVSDHNMQQGVVIDQKDSLFHLS